MPDIPADAEWGVVTSRLGRIVSDGPDTGREPDVVDFDGTVTLTPFVEWFQLPSSGMFHVDTLVCPIVGGVITPPDSTEPGVPALASEQPNGVPSIIQWTATFQLEGVETQPPPVVFNVPGGGETVALETQLGEDGTVPYVLVVTTEDRLAAQLAASDAAESRDEATLAAGRAATAQAGAEDSAQAAEGSAAQAGLSAGEAATARDDATAAADRAETAAGSIPDTGVSSVNGQSGEVVLDAAAVGAVPSVNGMTGAVTLTAADVGAAATEHTHTIADVTDLAAALADITKRQGTVTANAVTVPARTSTAATVIRSGRTCQLQGTVTTAASTATPSGTGNLTVGTPVVLWDSSNNPAPAGFVPSASVIGAASGAPASNPATTPSLVGSARLSMSGNGGWTLVYYPATATTRTDLTITFTVTYVTNDPWPA